MTEPLIEVFTTAGDSAEVDSPEAAIAAARHLLRDARESAAAYGARYTASIYVNGVLVRERISATDVGA